MLHSLLAILTSIQYLIIIRLLQKQTRSTSLFNLDDDDENLTHYGQSLANIDDFDEADLELSDSEDRGIIDPRTVSRAHFGGFGEEEDDMKHSDRPKSKAEVMREVIAKSKLHKVRSFTSSPMVYL